jgi:hypothetical protein
MGRFHNQLLASLLLSSVAALISTGCVDNESSLFIQGALVAEPPDCTVTADPTAPLLGEGTLDVAFASEFRAWLLVGNQLTARGRKQQVRAETARIALRGAEVVLTDAAGGELGAFTVPGTGFVTVSRSEEPGYGAFLATLLPASELGGVTPPAVPGAYTTVVANVRVFGDTLGGEELESAELAFPIRVCYGCTVRYPADALDENGGCTVGSPEGDVCFYGQEAIDCRNCRGLEICDRLPG